MVPDAFHFVNRYSELKMPVTIVAGAEDRLIDVETQFARLHCDVEQSRFHRIPGNGHMVHQTATDAVCRLHEIAEAAESKNSRSRSSQRYDGVRPHRKIGTDGDASPN